MARAKDDRLLNRLFEGPDGENVVEDSEAARAREGLRRAVLGILESAGENISAEPLDDGLISAYLDDALDADQQAALEVRLAASSVLREQVAAASLAREAGLQSGLAMPPAFVADYDDVPGLTKAAGKGPRRQAPALIGWLFAGPRPARRWLAATVPVLAVVVVAGVAGRQWVSERAPLRSGEGDGVLASKVAPEAEVKRKRAEERPADGGKRDAQPRPAEAAKPKPETKAEPRRRLAEQPGRAGGKDDKAGGSGAGSGVLTTTVVPLSSELRDAVVTLGRSQQGLSVALPSKKELEKRSFAPARPSTGSSGDKPARRSRSDKPAAGMLSQGKAKPTPRQIDVINRAIAPDCTRDPAACCGSHQVDQDLLNRLLTSQPPLHSVKVLHLSTRACYLTLP